jgi:DNA adenine methylase
MLESMSYPGGKSGSGVYQTLINLMPPHDVYVEAFLGGGGVMREKLPAGLNVGIDLDRASLETVVLPEGSPLPALSAGISRSGEARRRRSAAPAWGPGILDPLIRSEGGSSRSQLTRSGDGTRYELRHGDAIEFLRSVPLPPSALVYCDPPYLRSTRATKSDLYKFEMTDAQHRELLHVLKALPCRVIISGYSSTLYAKELKGWNATAFQAATRGKPAAEWVWFNYDKPVELHDYRYLGDDFREREQIKRMQRRWVAKLGAMPILKRQALLAAIAATA